MWWLLRFILRSVYAGSALLGALATATVVYEINFPYSLPPAADTDTTATITEYDGVEPEVVQLLGCTDDPCIIEYNSGGDMLRFNELAHETGVGVLKEIIVNGPCQSACAYFSDKARPRVCITEKAVFEFHKVHSTQKNPIYLDPIHSPDIQKWVMEHGGYPTEDMLTMSYAEAKKFWPTCGVKRE